MSGNTRGKLKEHLEGIHRNLDWCVHHTAKSMNLVAQALANTDGFESVQGDKEKEEAFFMENSVYKGLAGMGEGLQTFDEIAKRIYEEI